MRRAVRNWTLIGLSAGSLLTAGNLFQPTVVVGNSMAPTLRDGRVLWVDRTYYRNHAPARGEVVVFRLNGETYVKRVYRAPSETVHYLDSDGEWVAPIRESRLTELQATAARRNYVTFQVREVKVPKNAVFVLGDNVNNSEDSRKFGPVPMTAIIGKAHADLDFRSALDYEIAPQRSIPANRLIRKPEPAVQVTGLERRS